MDYQRISRKPSLNHHFSPTKLRAILLGLEKQQQQQQLKDDDFQEVEEETLGPSTVASIHTGGGGDGMMRDQLAARVTPKMKSQEEDEWVQFEFHRQERPMQRPPPVLPFSKPTPSKWDNAEKWISSPTSNRGGRGAGGRVVQPKKSALVGKVGRDLAVAEPKVVMEIGAGKKAVNWMPLAASGGESVLIADNPVAELEVSLNQHDSSQSIHDTTMLITKLEIAKSSAMVDIGTGMTPIASQESSRTGTPVRATTSARSPTSSCPPTPPRKRMTLSAIMAEAVDCNADSGNKELVEQELQMDARREIMLLGTKLGKANIASWASTEQEETNVSTSPKTVPVEHSFKSATEHHAAIWEETEKVKYLARFKQEQVEIQAWENHQKAKAEAEMRKTQVEVERMRAHAQDRLMKKLAAVCHKAEEKRATAETKRNQKASKTAYQADYIRRTGRIPSSPSCWGRCL